jgi:hypothetical protein
MSNIYIDGDRWQTVLVMVTHNRFLWKIGNFLLSEWWASLYIFCMELLSNTDLSLLCHKGTQAPFETHRQQFQYLIVNFSLNVFGYFTTLQVPLFWALFIICLKSLKVLKITTFWKSNLPYFIGKKGVGRRLFYWIRYSALQNSCPTE